MPDQRELLTKFVSDFLSETLKDGGIANLWGIQVAGIEVTQAIQWYDASSHLTDPADRGPDNGVTLVVNKPAWVRIYVGGLTAHAGVTASLTLRRQDAFGRWRDAYSPIQQRYGTVDYDPTTSYATTRRNLSSTLNFVIPAEEMHGSFQLEASVEAASGATATRSATLNVTLLQTLQVRGIPIRYWGPDATGKQVQLGPTTAAEFAGTATWPMLTYPVENVPSISLAGILTWSEPLSGPATVAGGCSTGWSDLLFWLHLAKAVDGNKPGVIYFGLLPAGTPNGPVTGCDSGDASAGVSGDGITMAHELGHYQGFPHSPCGSVGTPDAGYPAYEPYDTVGARKASIGEFGLDVSTGAIYDPAVAKDYMSYCGPPWTSLYHYNGQIGSSWFNPRYTSSRDRPPWWDHERLYREYSIPRDLPYPAPVEEYPTHERPDVPLEPSLVVTGMVHDGRLEVRSVLRLDAVRGTGEPGAERLEVLDAEGAVISGGPLLHAPIGASGSGDPQGGGSAPCGGCGDLPSARSECPQVVQAVVRDVDGAAAMRVIRGDEVLWSVTAPERRQEVGRLRAEIGDEGIQLHWQASPGDAQETHLRLSSDGGGSWSLLELALRTTKTTIPLEVLPPGRHLVQVLVSDGFHTATSESVEIDVPHRPPMATIHWPLDRATVASSAPMRLWGSGMSAGTEPLEEENHTWILDGRQVGRGRDLWVGAPEAEGDHLATLNVRDDHGETSVTSRFWVSDSGLAPRRLAD